MVVEIAQVEVLHATPVGPTMERDGYVDRSSVPASIFIQPFTITIIKMVHSQFSVNLIPWGICDISGFEFGLTNNRYKILKALL